ncbi:MAG TPA: hypothetical protein VK611_29330 [Acidimicrobiales bacterium]|nr:hypothetical protein [Acidimicrobiales bacterium]
MAMAAVVPADPIGERVDRRSRYLADGLRAGGLLRADVVVLCCDAHTEDRLVALLAGERAGRPTRMLEPSHWRAERLRQLGRELDGPLVLACEEGVAAWQASGARGRVVADGAGTGILWWRLVELQGRMRLHIQRGDAAC